MHAGAGGGRRTEYLPGGVRGFLEKTSSVRCHHEADRSATDRKMPAGCRQRIQVLQMEHICVLRGYREGHSSPPSVRAGFSHLQVLHEDKSPPEPPGLS